MLQDLLRIVQRESSKYGQAAIKPDALSPHQCSGGGCREDEGSKAADCDESNTSEERATKIKVFLLLGSCADESNGTHHCNGVETCTGKDSWAHKEEWRKDGGLGKVKSGPKSVFLNVAVAAISVFSFHIY